jgi:hypothetical protein
VRAIKPVGSTRGLTVLVYAVGIVGVILDSWPRPAHGAWILHALFGILLWIAVFAQFQREGKDVRQLSRAVYLLLYLLFGVNQIVRIGASLWHSQAQLAAHPAILQPPENLRDYLACGILALVSIHVMSALRAVNARRRQARQTYPARSSGAGEVAPPWLRAAVQNRQ